MTSLDTGTYGAKVQSWRRANPRDLLKQIMDETSDPKDKKTILSVFRDRVRGDDGWDYLDSIIEYWFSNNYHSLMDENLRTKRAAPNKLLKSAKIAEFKKKVAVRIRQEALFLLDTMLPNGKTLRDSTFGECAKIGGVLSKIANSGKPTQVVGKVLTDVQLRKLQAQW